MLFRSEHVNTTEVLNLDLNTGRELSLADIFANDVDYIGLLNDRVSSLILSSTANDELNSPTDGPYIKLVSPFKGITADQRFFISRGELTLLIDHRNPVFDTMFATLWFSFPFTELGPNIAVTQRFYNPDQIIFASQEPLAKEFMGGDYGTLKTVTEQQVVGHGVIRFAFSYPEKLPTHMVALLEQLSPEYTARASELAALPQPWELTNSVTASTIGPYLAVTVTQNTYLWDDSGDTRAWYYCFDKDYQQMSLGDVFAEGYAYREILEKRLIENLNLKDLSSAYSNDQIIDDLQFTLEASAVRFCTKTILFGSGQTLYFQIPYKDFGCHNMTIFPE